jgi:hypothetical protein
LAALELEPDAGLAAVVVGGIDQQPAGVGGAGLGDRALATAVAGGVLGDDPDVDGELVGMIEALRLVDHLRWPRRSAQHREQLMRAPDHPLRGHLTSGLVEDRDRRLVRVHVKTDPTDAVRLVGTSSWMWPASKLEPSTRTSTPLRGGADYLRLPASRSSTRVYSAAVHASVATARTTELVDEGEDRIAALTEGFQLGLIVAAGFVATMIVVVAVAGGRGRADTARRSRPSPSPGGGLTPRRSQRG